MQRLVIAIDCDDVLVQTTAFLTNAYNKKYGTRATLAQSHDPAYDIWQADEDEQIRRWGLLTQEEGYADLGPDPIEAQILHRIAKGHELHLVTARKEHEREFTQEMLDRELRGVFTSMEFVGWKGSKGEVCRSIGADVLIDDNIPHLRNAVKYGLPLRGAVLFGSYPWQGELPQDMVRCLDWNEVETEIARIASEGSA